MNQPAGGGERPESRLCRVIRRKTSAAGDLRSHARPRAFRLVRTAPSACCRMCRARLEDRRASDGRAGLGRRRAALPRRGASSRVRPRPGPFPPRCEAAAKHTHWTDDTRRRAEWSVTHVLIDLGQNSSGGSRRVARGVTPRSTTAIKTRAGFADRRVNPPGAVGSSPRCRLDLIGHRSFLANRETIALFLMDKERLKYVAHLQLRSTGAPSVPLASGKVVVLVGIRRSGKTFLSPTQSAGGASGDRRQIVQVSFEDDRLHLPYGTISSQARGALRSGRSSAISSDSAGCAGLGRFVRRLHDTRPAGFSDRLSSLSPRDRHGARGRCLLRSVPLSFPSFDFRGVVPELYAWRRPGLAAALDEYLETGGLRGGAQRAPVATAREEYSDRSFIAISWNGGPPSAVCANCSDIASLARQPAQHAQALP